MLKKMIKAVGLAVGLLFAVGAQADTGAYLQITLKIEPANRATAVGVYEKYKQPFLKQIKGAQSKKLLVRDDDVQVLHGFQSTKQAQAYLASDLFNQDVVRELGPLLAADPEVRVYMVH